MRNRAANIASIDVGSASSTHGLLWGMYPSGLWCQDEWVYNGKEDGQLHELEQINRMLSHWGDISIAGYIVDPAANSFQLMLEEMQTQPVIHAINDKYPGIQLTRTMMNRKQFFIDDCPVLTEQLYNYEWDEKASERGEDKTAPSADHGPDAMRYFCYTYSAWMNAQSRGGVFIGGRNG